MCKRGLEPAFGAGDPGGVDAIGSVELCNCLREIVADRAFGEMKFIGDLGAAAAITCALENLTFTIGKGIENHHLPAGIDEILIQDRLLRARVDRPIEQKWMGANFAKLHDSILKFHIIDLFN